jgi:hypothetical protein
MSWWNENGITNSLGHFLGFGQHDNDFVPPENQALNTMNSEAGVTGNGGAQGALQGYAQGGSLSDALNSAKNAGLDANQMQGFQDQLATGATTGSRFATDQVQGNSLLMGGLNAMKGQLDKGNALQDDQTGRLTKLQDQGFQLTPEDQTMYGQSAGNIGRLFGQQGNQVAQDLASRGLASAPSGAAGVAFSGLAGSQNEQLARAQQSIMQQRFQNTMQQIGQQQQFIGQLNGQNATGAANYASQGAQDINQQYARQQAGVQTHRQGLQNAAAQNMTQTNQNLGIHQANLGNDPTNFMDYGTAGLGSSLYNAGAAPGKLMSSAAGAAGSAIGGGAV